jgi:FkbM family methyltransferase
MKKFYGQFTPKQDEYLYNTFFKDYYNGISIEAGASNGILENNTKFFEENLNWKTINIEPLPEWYDELIINRPNSININCCLTSNKNNETINFYIPHISDYKYKNHLGSLNKDNLIKYNTELKEITVKTITYNEIINKYNIKNVDLFVLDIEGDEINFLQSFNEWLVYPKVFVIEIGHIDENKINDILKDKYDFFGIFFVNHIYTLKKSF